MRFETLAQWLSWIESCHPAEIELGLERIGKVLADLGVAFVDTKVITIAGTNGKGSCAATLNTLLRSSGLNVGCYTSPPFYSL